jgi:hypothetical protein
MRRNGIACIHFRLAAPVGARDEAIQAKGFTIADGGSPSFGVAVYGKT